MSEKIVVPALGESVTEATVSKWLKTVGEKVDSDEPVVELETDKVNVEVPSPSDGILGNISVKEGDTVEVGALLGSIGAKKIQRIEKEEKKEQESDLQISFSFFYLEVPDTTQEEVLGRKVVQSQSFQLIAYQTDR